MIQDALEKLLSEDWDEFGEAEARQAALDIMNGEASDVQIGAFLVALRMRGETAAHVKGFVTVMREKMEKIGPLSGEVVVDTCGTGGDVMGTFNISTAAAIVAAAAGRSTTPRVRVAKHGGRSRSGRGSAEVLAALGVNVDASPEVQARCLDEVGVCFSFAVNHHPAMKFAAGPRKSLGFPTIFNLLGPLCNPAGARRQLMGVYDGARLEVVGEALRELGAERALVVRGEDGMDELTTTAPTRMVFVSGAGVRVEVFDSGSVGIGRARIEDLTVSTLEEGAELVRSCLAKGPAPAGARERAAREIVALNAGAAVWVGGGAASIADGIELARTALRCGDAAAALEGLRRVSRAGS